MLSDGTIILLDSTPENGNYLKTILGNNHGPQTSRFLIGSSRIRGQSSRSIGAAKIHVSKLGRLSEDFPFLSSIQLGYLELCKVCWTAHALVALCTRSVGRLADV